VSVVLPPPTLQSIRDAAAVFPGVRLVALFGSLAREAALPTSDADIGILGGGFWDQLTLGSQIGALIGREPHPVDLASASDLLRFEVARDGVLLYAPRADDWPRFQAEAAIRYLDLRPTIALCAEGVRARLRREARHG
jgi:predicted nucleotidyltransferase